MHFFFAIIVGSIIFFIYAVFEFPAFCLRKIFV